ncbi:hypothetical protein LBMAG53_11820 [Planctomycetota bacterium]|nr:hypothetical protein LBMAG53_11820 [Planctomycetota bacterium]
MELAASADLDIRLVFLRSGLGEHDAVEVVAADVELHGGSFAGAGQDCGGAGGAERRLSGLVPAGRGGQECASGARTGGNAMIAPGIGLP